MGISTTKLTPFALGDGSVESIQTSIGYVEANLLRISYALRGDLALLNIPVRASTRRADRLWETTCFEAFLRVEGDSAYYEFNFSPSGEWAAYWFRGYRDGGPMDNDNVASGIVARRSANRIELDALVHLDRLQAIRLGSLLRIGLSAVIEDHDGGLSYWALKHPGAKPDFHHPDSFALELAFPSQSA